MWILGGSPGCGKTFTAAALIRLLGHKHGWESIAVAAPTGKAAVRITEAMKNNRVPLRAKTIHSLLGVTAADHPAIGDSSTVNRTRCRFPLSSSTNPA